MRLFLREFRKARGMTQSDLALAINTTKRVIGAYERSETSLPIEVAYEMTEILGCTLDELCGRKVNHVYSDARQSSLNASYENMNDAGKSTLTAVARSMEKDTANRIVKDGQECLGGEAASG